MDKELEEKLDGAAPLIEWWLGPGKLSLEQVRQRLARQGCRVEAVELARWWSERRSLRAQTEFLDLIVRTARQKHKLERSLGRGAPGLETLIQAHRVLVLKFSQESTITPELLQRVKDLMKPVMEWARLEEQRKRRELAERRYRDLIEAERAAAAGGISPATMDHFQTLLNLT